MSKRPRDVNQLAKAILDIATGEAEDSVSERKRVSNPKGSAGGLKGGIARSKSMSAERRTDVAKKAAAVRWKISGRPR